MREYDGEIENRIFRDLQWAAPDLALLRFSRSGCVSGERSGSRKTSLDLISWAIPSFSGTEAHASAKDNPTITDSRRPRDSVKQMRVYILAHQFFLVDQQQHEDQHKRQYNSVQNL